MFKSIKSLIDSRLGRELVIADLSSDFTYFIKLNRGDLYVVLSFLKNDPDVKLTLLDQIICLSGQFMLWDLPSQSQNPIWQILYQFKSLKLPYRVTLAVDVNNKTDNLSSIAPLFAGARWLEADLRAHYGITIDESERDLSYTLTVGKI